MRKYIIVCSLLSISVFIQSQEKWSLRQCIKYAVENNIQLKQQYLDLENAEIELNTAKNSRLPDLNASVGQDFNFRKESILNKTTGESQYQTNNLSTTSFGISSSTPLFTGFRIPNQIKVNELNLRAAIEGLRKAKDNLELQVTSYYLEVLFKKEILKVYQEQAELTRQQVERTKILVESGRIASSQLYDIKAQLAKDELNITLSQNDLTLSILNLSQLLNIQSANSFDIGEPAQVNLLDVSLYNIVSPDQVYQMALGVKPQVREAEYLLESSKKNLNVAKAGYLPVLSLNLSYGNGFGHSYNFDNIKVSDQLKNGHNEIIGLSLAIPIFDRFITRNQVRKAKLNIENKMYELDNVKLNLYKEIQQAYQSAVAAKAKYNSTGKAYSAAEESFKYARERYDIGKATVFEFNEVLLKLSSSKSEQIQAKYDFLFRSKILDFYQGKPIEID